ncbi:MAG TPA: N-acetylmuramoyl-L-alanine amidase [Bryobacteraceae bacterium]|nr:N-acetylmuramoyl-L-alanine amidase [Bryobacteraceae bacterium]
MLHLPKISGARWRLLAAILSCATLQAQDSTEVRHVKAVRFWTLGDITRVAIEIDGDFRVRSDRLENPERLFFDLIGTRPALGPKGITVIPVSDRLVQRIRVAETQHNVTRVVLDLEGATAEVTTSRLENPDRLIIEIHNPAAAVAKSTPKPPIEAEVVRAREPLPPKPDPIAPVVTERRPFQPPPVREAAPRYVPSTSALETPPTVSQAQSSAAGASLGSRLSPADYRASPPPPPVTLAKVTTPAPSVIPPAPAPVAPTAPAPAPKSALPAKRNMSGDRSMIRVLGLKVGKIVLDAGHGGHDTGTIGPDGLREKDLVLDVAQRLGALIEERLGSEVIYTRSDDTFIPLERRTEIANQAKADLFLSIHANSSPLASVAGVETYYLNFTTSKSAIEVAARENSGSEKSIFELQDLLQKIALKDKVEESREFATRVQSALYSFTVKNDPHARDRGVRKAPFVVLIGASMPSVLAEIGFISNSRDEATMNRPEYRQKLAEALFKGLSNYAGTLSHFQVAQRH